MVGPAPGHEDRVDVTGIPAAWRRIAVLVVATFIVLLFTAFYPYRQLQAGRSEREKARVELAEKERERAALEQRVALLREPAEVERLARERYGLARPGEVPFIVVPER